MNGSKLSINRACAMGAAFLGVISAAAIVAAVLLTRNPAVVWLGLLFAALVLACVAAFVAFLRRKLVLFSDNLCRTIDDMLDDAAPPPQIYEEENLFYKINHRLARLYEVLRENRESIAKERADLQELISDISHQVKTPIAALHLLFERMEECRTAEGAQLRQASEELFKIEQYAEMALHYARLDGMSADMLLKEYEQRMDIAAIDMAVQKKDSVRLF